MTDLYTRINEQPQEVLDTIAKSLNVRASEPSMQAICANYMAQIARPAGAHVLEIGCGNGATTKLIMQHIRPARLVGIDPCSAFLDMARFALSRDARVSFAPGEAAATGQGDASFDLVIAHTVFSHLVDPVPALAEAFRVLKPGGRLAVFDGDFATISVALFDGDPLQTAVDAVLRHMMHAPYIMRRLPALVSTAGFCVQLVQPYGYVQTTRPDFLLALLSRGISAATRAGEIGQAMADGFEREARRRVEDGTFYGAILFLTLIARKQVA